MLFSLQTRRITPFLKVKCYPISHKWAVPLLLKFHYLWHCHNLFFLLLPMQLQHLLALWAAPVPSSQINWTCRRMRLLLGTCCQTASSLSWLLTFAMQCPENNLQTFSMQISTVVASSYPKRGTTLPPLPPPKSTRHKGKKKILPVLNNPVFLPIYIFTLKTVTHNQNAMVQVFTATVWLIVDTWGGINSQVNKLSCRKPFFPTRILVSNRVAQLLEIVRMEWQVKCITGRNEGTHANICKRSTKCGNLD